ncbi:MAG: transglutaminase family protein [Ornithinibacter sp.]
MTDHDTARTSRSASVRSSLDIPVDQPGRLVLSVAVAEHLRASESLAITDGDGAPVDHQVLTLDHGSRLHLIDASAGSLHVDYSATVEVGEPGDQAVSDADRFRYVLPSRYCPSDRLEGFVAGEFGPVVDDAQTLGRVVSWVSERLAYTPGSTTSTDDALAPLLSGQGVCRDYAHLVVTMCRALGMPARYVSVYAPGLSPMDAHAVVEVAVDGVWRVVDATHLAPRASMVRTATGRDATDTAILTSLGAITQPPRFEVMATADPDLPTEDPEAEVSLA